jgi:hypothetical protein
MWRYRPEEHPRRERPILWALKYLAPLWIIDSWQKRLGSKNSNYSICAAESSLVVISFGGPFARIYQVG